MVDGVENHMWTATSFLKGALQVASFETLLEGNLHVF